MQNAGIKTAVAALFVQGVLVGAAGSQERMTPGDCRSRCDAVQKQCETQCAGNPAIPGGNCQGFCAMQVESCRQGCAALGTTGEPARRKKRADKPEAVADVGLRPLTVTLDYARRQHERYVPDPQSGSATRRGEAMATWTMEAKIVLEVPDVDYDRGLNNVSYVAGRLSAPEHLQGKGRRQRLPAPRLVALTGKTSYAVEGHAVVKAPMAADCKEQWSGAGVGILAPAQPGDVRAASFEIAFGGGKGIVDMQSSGFTVETKTTGSCPGEQAQTRRSEERIGTREVLYAVMTASSLVSGMPFSGDPACTHKLEATGGVYRGTARCERKREGGTRGWSEHVAETETLSYAIELVKNKEAGTHAPRTQQ